MCTKYSVKIFRNMQFICKVCRSLNIAYFAFICRTPHFADGDYHDAQCQRRASLAA